jgi:hypothetical protein
LNAFFKSLNQSSPDVWLHWKHYKPKLKCVKCIVDEAYWLQEWTLEEPHQHEKMNVTQKYGLKSHDFCQRAH